MKSVSYTHLDVYKRQSTPYYYSVYGGENEADGKTDKKKVLILGSGPIRIGQGIESVSYTHLKRRKARISTISIFCSKPDTATEKTKTVIWFC